MLGHKMFQTLREHFPGTVLHSSRRSPQVPPSTASNCSRGTTSLRGVDVTDFPALDAILSAFRPEYVVNCVGVIKQRAEAACPDSQHHDQLAAAAPARPDGRPLGRTRHSLQHRLRIQRQAWGLRRKRFLRRRGSLRKNPNSWARWRPRMPSPCGLPSSAGNSANIALCSTGSSRRITRRFADTGESSTPE